MSSRLSVCLSAGLLKKLRINLHEIFGRDIGFPTRNSRLGKCGNLDAGNFSLRLHLLNTALPVYTHANSHVQSRDGASQCILSSAFRLPLCRLLSAKLHYTDTGYGHVVQHHQRRTSQQLYLLYNKFTNGQKFATSQCQSPGCGKKYLLCLTCENTNKFVKFLYYVLKS